MTEREWQLARELAQTKLALYGAQNAFLQLAVKQVETDLAALGEKWQAPSDDAPVA